MSAISENATTTATPIRSSRAMNVAAPRMSGRKAAQALFVVIAMFVLLLTLAGNAVAQTAHFSVYQAVVNSGFTAPVSVAVDRWGDVFVADQSTGAVSEIVAVNGAVSSGSTVIPVGGGFQSPDGVAVDSAGDVFVADRGSNSVFEIVAANGAVSSSSPVNTLATGFASAASVAVDGSGNVYVTDYTQGVLYKLTAVNGVVPNNSTPTVLAASLSAPIGLAVDGNGNIFVSCNTGDTVQELPAGSTTWSPLPGPNGEWGGPGRIAVDGSGNLFVANNSNLVYEVIASNGVINSASAIKQLPVTNPIIGVAADNKGNIFLSGTSTSGNPVGSVVQESTQSVNMGTLNVGSASAAFTLLFTFDTPGTIGAPVVLTQGAINQDFADFGGGSCTTTNGPTNPYAASTTCTVNVTFTPKFIGLRLGAVELVDSNGNIIATAWLSGVGQGEAFTVDPVGLAATTTYSGFASPFDVAVDPAGDLFVADANGGLFEIPAGSSTPTRVCSYPSCPYNPTALAFDGKGNLYFSGYNEVFEVSNTNTTGGFTAGAVSTIISDTTTFGGTTLNQPDGLSVGPDGVLYVTDPNNARVVSYNLTTGSTGVRVSGGLWAPTDVAVDAAGTVYVQDQQWGLRVYPEGVTTTPSQIVSVNNLIPAASGVVLEPSGSALVIDWNTGDVVRIPIEGGTLNSADAILIENGTTSFGSSGIALDAAGNIYTAEGDGKVSVFHRTAASLDFGSVTDGLSATPQTFYMQNSGNQAMQSWGDGWSQWNSAFTVNSGWCPAWYPGDVCAFTAGFSPVSGQAGTETSLLALYDDYGIVASVTFTGQAIPVPAATPTFSVQSGTYLSTQTVGISSPNGGSIYYTVTPGSTGTTPTTASTLYIAPITVSSTETIEAIAVVTNYGNSTAASATYTINSAATLSSLALTATPLGNSAQGSPVILTAQLSLAGQTTVPVSAAIGEPVTFYSGTVNLGTGVLDVNGIATLTTSTLPNGTNALTAFYSGDASLANSTSNTLSYNVTAISSSSMTVFATVAGSTTQISSGAQVIQGAPLTLIASVAVNGSPVTTGQVNFCNASVLYCTDINRLGTAQLNGQGTASLTLYPGVGTLNYIANYMGTPNSPVALVAPSSSNNWSATVVGATTTAIANVSGVLPPYAITAVVTSAHSSAMPLTGGTLSALDISDANLSLGTATLAGATLQSFVNPNSADLPVSNAQFVVAGDFDGDGIPDIAVSAFAAGSASGQVILFKGNGDGTFSQMSVLTTDANPSQIVVGDFNGDGRLDLAVVNSGGNNGVTVFLNSGNWSFTAKTVDINSILGTGFTSLAVGDFNLDGNLDLAALNSNGSVAIILGDGAGNFVPQTATQLSAGAGGFIATADFRGIGRVDLVTTNNASRTVTVLLNNGDGTFQPGTTFAVGNTPSSIAVGDFNSDGKPDLAVVNSGDGTVSVLKGDGTGNFTTSLTMPVGASGSNPDSIAIGDFNGDRIADLAVANANDNTVTILQGIGDGTFVATVTPLSVGLTPQSIATADFNADGLPDFVTSNMAGTVTLQLTQLTQTATATISGITPQGAGTHQVEASLQPGGFYAASNSSTVPLIGLTATNLTLVANPGFINAGQSTTLTATVGINGASAVVNGGFETGDFTGWTSDGNEDVESDLPHSGSSEADFWAAGTYGVISQTLSTQAGASYTLSFWLANNATGGTTCDFQVTWNGVLLPGGDFTGCGSFGYTQYTFTVLGTGSDTLAFAGRNDPASYFLDDVSLISNVVLASRNGETVTFTYGGTTLGTGVLQNGVATLPTTALPVGTDSVTATYSGDSATIGSSASTTVTVAGAPQQLVVYSGDNQTGGINLPFPNPLQVQVLDANSNPVIGQTVNFTVTPSNGATATLSASTATTAASGANVGIASVTATANGTAGSYIVTATAGTLSGVFHLTNVLPPVFTVTTLNDDASAAPGNCTNQALSGALLDANCSLRDAIAAAIQSVAGTSLAPTVNFATTMTYGTNNQTVTPTPATPGAINIDTGGPLQLGADIPFQISLNIVGPGANSLSIASAGLNRIFYVDSNVIATISGLTITGGTYNEGSGIKNFGALTLNNCTVSNNVATKYSGGGIHNAGMLTVNNSTISGNTAANNGGGIVNYGAITVNNSTIVGNTATNNGGGLYNGSQSPMTTATMVNSTISGNQDGGNGSAGGFSNAPLTLANNLITDSVNGVTQPTDNGGNLVAGATPSITIASLNLAPLGYYGGTTQTMPPLPGSVSICAGLTSNVTNIATATDQRGVNFPRANIAYPGFSSSSPCVDAGSVQTNYALAFTTEPPSSVQTGVPFTASNAPQLTLTESGTTSALVNGALPVTGNPVALSVNSVPFASGIASFSGVSVPSATSNEQLIATLSLNANLSTPLNITATSTNFIVGTIALSPSTLANGTVGVAYSATFTAVGGSGSYTYTATGLPAGLTLNSTSGVLSGTPTSANTFNPIVTATDTNGASISQPYTLTIAPAPPLPSKVALVSSGATQYYGQSVTFTASVTSSGAAIGSIGSVTFYDSATSLGSVPVQSGQAAFSTSSLSAGAHSITASYTGTGYATSTSDIMPDTVNPAAVDINGSVTGSSISPLTMAPGGNNSTTFTVASLGTLSGSVNLSCSGLTEGLTCQLSPSTIAVASLPATVTVKVTSGQVSADNRHRGLAPLGWALAMMLPGVVIVRGRRKLRLVIVATVLSLLLLFALCSCGGGKKSTPAGNNLTPAGTYTGTITATSTGATTATATVTVVVQ